jgi:hypothetical protein
MVSPPILRISPGMRSGQTDLFLPIALILLLGFNIYGECVACVFPLYVRNIVLTAKY